jgi:hypothetical protein
VSGIVLSRTPRTYTSRGLRSSLRPASPPRLSALRRSTTPRADGSVQLQTVASVQLNTGDDTCPGPAEGGLPVRARTCPRPRPPLRRRSWRETASRIPSSHPLHSIRVCSSDTRSWGCGQNPAGGSGDRRVRGAAPESWRRGSDPYMKRGSDGSYPIIGVSRTRILSGCVLSQAPPVVWQWAQGWQQQRGQNTAPDKRL